MYSSIRKDFIRIQEGHDHEKNDFKAFRNRSA